LIFSKKPLNKELKKMTKTSETQLDRDSPFSPLKRFQAKQCQNCSSKCDPSEKSFLACLLSALVGATEKALTAFMQEHSELQKLFVGTTESDGGT